MRRTLPEISKLYSSRPDHHFDWVHSLRQTLVIGDGKGHTAIAVSDFCAKELVLSSRGRCHHMDVHLQTHTWSFVQQIIAFETNRKDFAIKILRTS